MVTYYLNHAFIEDLKANSDFLLMASDVGVPHDVKRVEENDELNLEER